MTLSAEAYRFLQTYVERHSAIVLDAGKEYLVESRLAPIATALGLPTITALVDRLRLGSDQDLRRRVVEAMTTNETSFFRDRHPFDALRTEVLPKLLAARRPARKLRIWCGASSTGQEPYSIAMTLLDGFPELTTWDVRILATDLAEDILARASLGSFSQLEVNRGLSEPLLSRHFARAGARWEVRPQLRKLVEFRQMNLAANWPEMPQQDVVFLRNVLIYFGVETKRRILGSVRRCLAADGLMFLGTAETTLGVCEEFEKRPLGPAIGYAPKCAQVTR